MSHMLDLLRVRAAAERCFSDSLVNVGAGIGDASASDSLLFVYQNVSDASFQTIGSRTGRSS